MIAAPDLKYHRKGQLRKQLDVEVDPGHGLWAFFRKKEINGSTQYETIEPRDAIAEDTGRSWKAVELRRKSFKDLHTLWYLVLKERNLLATQREEGRRIGVSNPGALAATTKMHQCRKTMARIKFVINERRLVFEKHAEALKFVKTEIAVEPSQKTRAAPRTRAERMKVKRRSGMRGSAITTESLPPSLPAATPKAKSSSTPSDLSSHSSTKSPSSHL
ncbi:hypothetical protein SERLADRAFT_392744 [Serpula lacrymans var. lacrymans S7.9]|nr:uncharacterized protein SERLADRAFT_392744 [Serpula lacrymans var. lacrymans S7.9]EGO23996.1 hypothetical protein SERLADRAFT_392744 [Serpula lacrymans var. lacrymans S7.9]